MENVYFSDTVFRSKLTGMKNRSTPPKIHENRIPKNVEFPLHNLGDDFFAMTTIESDDDYFFEGTHRHDFYELLWFCGVKSHQTHSIDFIEYPIADNQVFLLLPDQVYNMDRQGKTGFVFGLTKDFFERLVAGDIRKLYYHTSNFSIIIPDGQVELFHTLLNLIKTEYESEKRPAILESYLRSWFLHCIEIKKSEVFDELPDSRLQALVESIETHFKAERKASFYADELSLSAKRLNELTKKYLGKTINQIINDRLIMEAKREISCGEKPIKEISYGLGFSEPSYFTRFFGKQTGYTPEDFRKKITVLHNS